MGNTTVKFSGRPCCLFSYEDAATAYEHMDTELVVDYGDSYRNVDGTIKHSLHTWDDGSRRLVKCKRCGALFLVQHSEYHGPEDSYYTDWYQVESSEAAESLNKSYGGFQLEMNYKAPWIKQTNSVMSWSNGRSS